jgi:hypothetical protein
MIKSLLFMVFCLSCLNAYSVTNKACFDNIAKQDTCSPVSTLPCNTIKVTLPYNLSFDNAVINTINDKNNQGTGFTTVNTYSGIRTSADGQPKIVLVPGYEPSKISLLSGRLQLTANKGIDYLTNNNQLNVLGVQIATAKKLQLDVKIINPFNGTQSQQAGLWYGLNDKTFIKLSITGNKVELRKELNDVSSTLSGTANPDQRVTGVITNLNTKTVNLRMVIDSAANTVEGFYSIDGINYISTGLSYSAHTLNTSGMAIINGTAYAGIYGTYRNASTPVTYTFDDFGVQALNVTPPINCGVISTLSCENIKVNLPFNLSFNAPLSESINDKNGQGTGFTTVNSYSGTRLAVDGQPAMSSIPGYEPSKIFLTGGRLQLTANKGIDYLTNNNQLNVLGVQVNSAGVLQLNAKLVNPYNGTQSQQGGLWIGLNDKTYIKLGVTGNKVELRKEFNDVSSSSSGSSNPDQRITSVITGLNTKTVNLRMVIDSIAQTVEGFYSTDGINYVSAGATGYASSYLNISGMGLTNGLLFAGIFSTYRNASSAVTYTFDDFSILQPAHTQKNISFVTDTLNFTVLKGGQVIPQTVNITSVPTINTINLSKANADWLTIPATSTATIQFGPANINSGINAGHYQGLVIANADGYNPDTLLINLNVVESLNPQAINVNFQDAQTIPPVGFVADYGQAYGARTGKNQGVSLIYGWRKRSDGSVLNLVGNGRNRNTPEDILLATVFHMQANTISGAFQGVKTEGYWELKVPNGTYDVTAGVGDGLVGAATEHHYINVEGANAITNFIPNGKKGDIGRFRSATVRVNVTDGNLTINADGGTNTKITNASVVPVSTSAYLYWAANTKNILIKKGSTANSIFNFALGSSNNMAQSYALAATYTAGGSGWLNFNSSPSGKQPNIAFNYSAAKNLPIGTYYSTVKATAAQFTGADLSVQLNVVDSLKPYVISSTPANGASKISLSTVSIAANNLHVPIVEGYQGGVDNHTITDTTVQLYKLVDMVATRVAGTVQGTGGGDAISFSPKNALEPNSIYKFVITSGVKSYPGSEFNSYEATFTTDSYVIDSTSMLNAQFTKVAIPGTQNIKYSSLTIGPDGKLYALQMEGRIERYNINHTDGTLSNKTIINTLLNKYGTRTAIGLVFDPNSTASNPILYVSHSSAGLTTAPAFDGNISRLHGADLELEQLLITKLPRSTRDHMVNSMAFGPDNALYICQGSNSSAGGYDPDWQRDESLLAGSVLRLDLSKLNAFSLPLNVQTTFNQAVINAAPGVSAYMSDGTYNPYGSQSPLTIYASGVRNAYDLVWHSNGQLYVPTNGSGGGGNSPASVSGTRRPNGSFYNGPAISATTGVQVQDDWVFRVNPAKPIGYYGHPNPLRGEFVINRGYQDNVLYSPSVVPDVNYRKGYNVGLNHSPDGALEYKSNAFNGILKGKLLVCRFSGGGDIVVMEPGSMTKIDSIGAGNDHIYDIVKVTTGSGYNGLVGMSGFANPLDIVEDVVNGNLYVAELNWNDNPNLTAQITLLRAQQTPAPPMPLLALTASAGDTNNEQESKNYTISLANKGDGILKVKSIALVSDNVQRFNIANVPLPTNNAPLILQKNSLINFNVNAKLNLQKLTTAKLIVTSIDGIQKEIALNDGIENDSTKEITNNNLKAVSNLKERRKLIVYPNPNSGNALFVKLVNFSNNEEVNISLYDMMGSMLKSVKGLVNKMGQYDTQFAINSDSKNHFYIIRTTGPSGPMSAKVIVNN